jgi:hypothetical protein
MLNSKTYYGIKNYLEAIKAKKEAAEPKKEPIVETPVPAPEKAPEVPANDSKEVNNG